MADRITVRERIDPGITVSLFANYRSAADALMELVDNAIDSRVRNRQLEVLLQIHESYIAIETRGGEGMAPAQLERNYLRWGGSSKRGRRLLGQYGQGGKAAIGHLGSSFSVESSRPGDREAWRFADPNYRDRSRLKTYDLKIVQKPVPVDLGWVRIRIDGVDKRVDPRRMAARLAETYRPLILRADLKMVVNGRRVDAPKISFEEDHPFSVYAGGATVKGWYGIAEPEGRGVDYVPGIRCYKLGRLISTGEFFGHPNAVQVAGMTRLIGEVELSQVPVTMNKTDFIRDGSEWQAVERRLHALLAPVAKRLAQDEMAPPPAAALKTAEQVRRLLSQVLRMTESEKLFHGLAVARHHIEPAARERTKERANREIPPSAPRPPAETDSSRRGFGQVIIRQLDRSIRSQTVIENKLTTVVINSRYPLFVKRGGDMWYQLETAAREVFRASDAVSIADYERRINEIVLLAFDLRSRKRQPKEKKTQGTLPLDGA